MKTRQLTLALLALSLLSLVAANAAPIIDSGVQAKIDQAAQDAISKHITPSCCIVIGNKDRVLFAKAYGRLTYDADAPAATLDTLYDMASCSKVVGTTSMTALLLQDGKLSLDDPISKYLPSWDRDDKRTITIRNLATHTSGLPAYTNASLAETGRAPGESRADALIKHIASLRLKYETNKGWLYACLNFLTLGRVNEEAAGTSQDRFLRARLFEPLGMTNSGYYLRSARKLLCAPTVGGASLRQGVVHDPLAYYYRDGYHCPGNAGLFTTANDLTKFCRMVLSDGKWGDKQIFTPQTIDLFSTKQTPSDVKTAWGIGWGISDSRPVPACAKSSPKAACISHTGYTGTLIDLDRFAGTFMVVLTNRVYPDDTTKVTSLRNAVRRAMIESDPVYKHQQAGSK